MKTFADIKRRLAVGAVLECVENTYRPQVNGQRRRVEVKQTNAIAFQVAQPDGSFLPEIPRRDLFWLDYPKGASLIEVIDGQTFRFAIQRSGHSVTLRFVGEAR
jgi:hypothetical protein